MQREICLDSESRVAMQALPQPSLPHLCRERVDEAGGFPWLPPCT